MSGPGEVRPGLVLVDKPGGPTSHDVVARVRRLAGTRKVGHAGTLDPMATGLLVLGIGRATRLLGRLTLTDKTYTATIRLGQATTTDDAEGEPVGGARTAALDEAVVRAALATQVGERDQVPSAVSAVKVDGRRAYARVRDGEEVDLPPRRVRIRRIDVLAVRPGAEVLDLDVEVSCSSGTYVRAIARDLGTDLGVGGHLVALRRTGVGPFAVDRAHTLEDLSERAETQPFPVLSLEDAARACFPVVDLTDDLAGRVRVGAAVPRGPAWARAGEVALLGPDGAFLALYDTTGDPARAVAVFVG